MALQAIGTTSKSLWTLDPRTLPGCVLWLDANDSNTLILSGSNVTTWNDKSEFGNNMTTTAGTGSITYSSTGFNGLPTLQFADNGRFCNAMQRYLFQSNITAAVVFQKTGLDSSFTDTLIGRYFSESTPIFGADTSSGNIRVIGNGTTTRTFDASGGFSLRTQQPNIYVFQTGSDLSWNEWWDGIQQPIGGQTDSGTVTYSDASAGFLTIGGFGTAPRRTFNGLISEVILFNTKLDRFERQRLEGYLANKWNMVYALPSNHPFGTSFLRNIIASPSAVPTCTAWYDGADSTRALVVNGSINVFLDKISNFHLTASATPTTTSPVYNGVERYIRFDGAQLLNISGGASLVVNTCYTIFVVEGRTSTNLTADQTFNPILGGHGTTANSNFVLTYVNNVNFRQAIAGTGMNICAGPFNPTFEKTQIWVASYDTVNRYLYSNGTAGVPSATTQNVLAWIRPSVGRWSGNTTTALYNGRIREMIFYKSALTDTERQQVEDYLGYKWGFYSNSANLENFRSSKPTFVRQITPLDISGCIGWYDAGDATTITLSGTTDVSGWINKALFNTDNLVNIGTRLPRYQIDPSTGVNAVYINTCSAVLASTASNTVTGNTFFCVSRLNSYGGSAGNYMLFSLPDLAAGDTSVRNNVADPYWDPAYTNASNTLWTPAAGGSLYYNGAGPLTLSGRTAPAASISILTATTGLAGTSRTGISSTFLNRGVRDVYYYEFLRYNRTLSSNERQKIEGYLAYKWGLADHLPATHPYSLYYGNDFLPTDIPTCRAWYDAGDSTSLVLSGNNVLRWLDKTGNGHDLSAIATVGYPFYISNQYVDFGAGNSSGLFIVNASSMVVNASFTIVLLEQRGTNVGSNYFMGGSGIGTNSNLQFGYRNDVTVRLGFWANDLDVCVGAYESAQTYNAWTALYSGTVRQIYINNSLIATSNTTQNLLDWSNAFIGRFPQGTNFYNGRMREILFFRSGLTPTELSNVHSYLAWKWNLQWKIPTLSTISNIVPPTNESFSPLQISNLGLWLDGADPTGNGVVPADGTAITLWADKSGSGNTGIGTGTYNTANRTIAFSRAASNYFDTSYSAALRSETLFAVLNTNPTANVAFADNIQTGGRQLGFDASRRYVANVGGLVTGPTDGPVTAGQTTILGYYCISNNATSNLITLYVDGSAVTTPTSLSNWTAGSKFTRIGSAVGTSTIGGYMYEFIGYSNTLQLSEIQKVEGYLAWKWGLWSNLPTTHPYRKTPP